MGFVYGNGRCDPPRTRTEWFVRIGSGDTFGSARERKDMVVEKIESVYYEVLRAGIFRRPGNWRLTNA